MRNVKDLGHIITEHFKDELRIHKDFFSGKRGIKGHYEDSIKIHKKVFYELKKFWKGEYQK